MNIVLIIIAAVLLSVVIARLFNCFLDELIDDINEAIETLENEKDV